MNPLFQRLQQNDNERRLYGTVIGIVTNNKDP